VDYSGKNVLETVGDSRSVTNNKKTLLDATGSLYFDGTSDYLRSSLPASYWNLSGDFTIEFWINPIGNSQSGSVYYDIIGTSNNNVYIGSGQTGWVIAWSAQYGLRFGWQNSNTWSIDQSLHSTTPTFNTWAHIAVVRRGSTITGYINGIAGSTPITSSTNFTSSLYSLHIGSGAGHQNFALNGYLQDVRITTIARYTGTFTPPVRTFSATVRDVGHKQWVVNNLSVASGAGNDSLVDTPTNYGTDTGLGGEVRGNYCTLNPLDNNAYSTGGVAWTLSNGNLTATSNTGSLSNSQGFTQRIPRIGKYYAEFTLSNIDIGINGFLWIQVKNYLNTIIGYSAAYSGANGWGSYGYYNGSSGTGTASISNGGVIMIAVDGATGKVWMGQNGTWFNSGNPASGTGQIGTHTFQTTTDELYFSIGARNGSTAQILDINFGQRPFAYTAPSGYKALCTQNLPAPSIVKPNTAFDALTYIGNGSTQTVSGLNFNPDLVWVKRRDGSGQDHVLQDVVRGFTSSTKLASSSQAAENNTGGGVTDPQWGYISATTSTGFTTTVGSGTGDQTNRTSWLYAGWVWDGGNNTVTNTTGTITSQVRSNPSAGFSIVGYTGAGGGTVGHGLNSAPQMMIVRDRNNLNDWVVYHEKVGNTTVLVLNNQNASVAANSTYWNNTSPTSSVFTTGSGSNTGQSGRPYIAYCFTSIPGYSMISSYTGNGAGSTTGQFIYTGFRPRFILIKSNSNTTEWLMMDAARNTANVVNFRLDANSTGIEITANYLDFLSNGFRLVHPSNWMNDNGYSFIYAAFAENPFKYSLAR